MDKKKEHYEYDVNCEVYYEAASILKKANEKRASLKTLIYASHSKNIRQLFALVNECVKLKTVLEEVLSHCSKTLMKADVVNKKSEVALVLLYEHLMGRKFGRAAFLRQNFAQKYRREIKAAVDKVLRAHNANTLQEAAESSSERISIQIPRYMRVNLIKSSVDNAVKELESEGWEFIGKISVDKFVETVKSLKPAEFGLDPMLFDVLIFPLGTDLHDHHLTNMGVLVQQDRASCIPAHALHPSEGSVVLDCCAAPGNKTSHLASLMKDKGRVIALDRDFKRMTTMSQLLRKSGATCVELIHQDFLTVQPGSDDAEDVKFILVDPSCSGSGMISSQLEKSVESHGTQRLQTLKRFQISILKHALRFPNVERVVYSTCSIHEEENEQVVEEVMAQVTEYFQFHSILPEWKYNRGLKQYPHHRSFLRLSPLQDLTQGFFVACFERMKSKQGSMMVRGKNTSAVKTADSSKDIRTGNNNNSADSVATRDDHPNSTSCNTLTPDQDSLSLPEGQGKKKKKMKRIHSEITADSDDTEKVWTHKRKKR